MAEFDHARLAAEQEFQGPISTQEQRGARGHSELPHGPSTTASAGASRTPAVGPVGGEQPAFVEQFPHGGRVGGSDRLVGANSFLAFVGFSRFGLKIRTIHAHVLTGQRRMAAAGLPATR